MRQLRYVALALIFVMFAQASPGTEPINVGSRRELFVDDYLVEKLDGARRILPY